MYLSFEVCAARKHDGKRDARKHDGKRDAARDSRGFLDPSVDV